MRDIESTRWRTIPLGWDSLDIHRQLARLTVARTAFRIRRTLERIRSPRRLIATALAIAFFVIYLLNGILILSARQGTDPERLRLWLSGGMVIYAMYHGLRCAWSSQTSDLDLTEAETLWLGGAPVQRSTLAVYHVGSMVLPTALKTLLLAVVLNPDVSHIELMLVGVFTSLILLETARLIIARWAAALDEKRRRRFRIATTAIAFSIGAQLIARVMADTPLGSATWLYILNGFRSLGDIASSDAIQWLAFPWLPSAQLSVTEHYQWVTVVQVLGSLGVLPLAIWLLVRIDARSSRMVCLREEQCLAQGLYQTQSTTGEPISLTATGHATQWIERWIPSGLQDAVAVMSRQWVSIRRYHGTIAFSFLIPTLLCLSPLVTGQVREQWFYVVGGIAICTMLLAPPALRVDFRRDLRRMILLRSLPVRPSSMVLGQLMIPIVITWTFQWITLAVAAIVTEVAWGQILLWMGILNALAVFTFATENALFLAYPHHERSEGVAMMVRTKLTFLGKGTVIVVAIAMLVAWATFCRRVLPSETAEVAFIAGAIIATWCVAMAAITAATVCWRRFDAGMDIPPQ